MLPRRTENSITLVLALSVGLALSSPPALAQIDSGADEAIEDYLEELDLVSLLTIQLERRLDSAPPDERAAVAERLSKLYAERLEQSETLEERKLWEERSRRFLQQVRDTESFELKISLAKVRYLLAEEIAERWRVGLAEPEETAEAERVLHSTAGEFHNLFSTLNERVRWLERRGSRGDGDLIERALADARRLRSLATYYSGWSDYYLALLTGAPSRARVALTQFGFILNAADGDAPTLDRLPRGLLRFEHVARSAVGSALCFSMRNQHDLAIRWLDEVEQAGETPDGVRKQLLYRRLVVLSEGKRWADIEAEVRRRRAESQSGTLTVREARLLAVLTLEAIESGAISRVAQPAVRQLAESALSDLVLLGEAGHVLNLVQRYGTAPIGVEGFIVTYVRGLQAYQKARDAHADAGEPIEEPSREESVRNAYRAAAAVLQDAVASSDASNFTEERTKAGISAGLALFYADDARLSSEWLEAVYLMDEESRAGEEALWLAIVSAFRAVETDGEPDDRLRTLATIYLERYPGTERSAKLLLRQHTADLMSEEEAVRILLSVDGTPALRESAERRAAGLLYRIFRRSRSSDRDFAALQFADVAERVLASEARKATEADDEAERAEAAERALTLARQLLEAFMAMSSEDVSRARRVLAVIDTLASERGTSLAEIADELAYRRLQLALATDDHDEAKIALADLHAVGGAFADAADRLMYHRAVRDWTRRPRDLEVARRVVRHGLNVMSQFEATPESIAREQVASLYDRVSAAAVTLWRAEDDVQMRDASLQLDKMLIDAGRTAESVLRRYAETSERAGRRDDALSAWRTMLSATSAPDERWYEARFETLRLLAQIDPARARQVLEQHRVLHPTLGPDPWGERFEELDARLPPAPPTPTDPAAEDGPR